MDTINAAAFIESYLDGVAKGECVLLLGPRFGMTADGRHVHEVIREQVLAFYKAKPNTPKPEEVIDTNFDNFFIFKKKGGPHELLELKFKLKTFYDTLQPHPIYQSLACMPFKGIINCSPDMMLKKTLDNMGIEHAFHYYSPKGQVRTEQRNDLPVVMNIFGRSDNPETLIVTYQDFFKFVMTLMGDESQIPLNLKNLLTDASFFILLGFDMDKWYVPLLVRKLNQGKEDARFTVLSKDNKFSPEDEQRLSTTLLLLEEEGMSLLTMMGDKLQSIGAMRTKTSGNASVLRELNNLLMQDNLDILLKQLIDQFATFGLQETDLLTTSGQLASLERDFLKSLIDNQTYQVGRGKVRESIKETLKTIGLQAV